MDTEKLNHIVQGGGIAIIDAASKIITPTLAKGRDFIAISHVWSHGLGNPYSNSMNACLLNKLLGYAEKCGSPAIWIDTLCVPTRRQFPDEWRIALDRMKSVYSTANKVLVIDEKLLGCSDDIALRQFELLQCDWMHRLWTLQEMLLPSVENILFAFGEEVVAAPVLLAEARCDRLSKIGFEDILHLNLCEKFQIEEGSTIQRPLLAQPIESILEDAVSRSQLMSFNTEDAMIQELLQDAADTCVASARAELTSVSQAGPEHVRKYHGISRLPYIKVALAERAATQPSDEPICLATLLDIDSADLPQQITMESIYVALGMVPLWLLHTPGSRLDSVGFRWALRSFMLPHAALVDHDPSYGAVTEGGLLFTQDLLVASASSLPPLDQDITLNVRGTGLPDDLLFTSLGLLAPAIDSASEFALLIHRFELLSENHLTMGCLLLIHQDAPELLTTHFLCAGMLSRGMPGSTTWDNSRSRSSYKACHVTLRSEVTILVG